MIEIKLNKPLLINGKYHVYLNSENRFIFENKRKATDFITHISRELEQGILFVTEELNRLHEFYRLYYLTDKDFKFKLEMKASLELIENRLNWINDRSVSTNSDVFIFQGIQICFNELATSFTLLMNKAMCRRDTLLKRRAALRLRIIDIYLKDLLKLGIKPISKVAPMALLHKVS